MNKSNLLTWLTLFFVNVVDLVRSDGFDPNKFKICIEASFCRRFKDWKSLPARPTISVNSFNFVSNDDDAVYIWDLLLKSSTEIRANYAVSLFVFRREGIVRVVIDEVHASRKRYRIPEGDVVSPLSVFQAAKGYLHVVTVEESDGWMIISVGDMYRIEIGFSEFVLNVYNTFGSLAQSINSENVFSFEKYRKNRSEDCPEGTLMDAACHPSISKYGAWEEYFGEFYDSKPYGPSAVGIDVVFPNSVRLYGLPEHTTSFALPMRGDTDWFRLFNSDVFEYPLDSTMGLYGTVPLVTAVDSSNRASGFLWLNPSETYVGLENFGSTKSVWVSETGVIDFFVFTGPSPANVLAQYHYVTGLPAMPPMFALGFHQSQWGYDSQEEVMEISQLFIDHSIPVDVLWLDIQHTKGNRYFVWNPETYGDPQKLISTLSAQGRKTVAIIDPHVKVDPEYYVYTQGSGRFVRDATGQTFQGQCWPGTSTYLDFTRSDVRAYWASLFNYETYKGSSEDLFVWNDMNEPSVFDGPEMTIPRDAIHGNSVRRGNLIGEHSRELLAVTLREHREVHNIYGQYYHRATFEGLLARSSSKKRPFVLSRSFFAGSHRYGPVWTGDNKAAWKHLRVSIPMLLSLAMSGMSFAGADVGGFFGDPSKELYIRWHQLGALVYPFYRCHAHIDSPRREPWTYDAQTLELVRDAIKLRYALLPYWYTQFALYALKGLPILRPVWFDYDWTDEMRIETQIFVGESLLVQGVFVPGLRNTDVYLPSAGDTVWYDLYEEGAAIPGNTLLRVPVTLASIPAFVKGGSIIPVKLTARHSSRDMKNDLITLRVYLSSYGAKGTVYIDDEESMGNLTGQYILIGLEYFSGELKATRLAGQKEMDVLHLNGVEFVGDNSIENRGEIDLPIHNMEEGIFVQIE